MRIDVELKLGFKDVLIRPKRSTLKSRSDVSLLREYTFKHSQQVWQGVPIFAANMDTIGTFSMTKALWPQQLLTAIHKHYSLKEWKDFFASIDDESVYDYLSVSCGSSDQDFLKVKDIMKACPKVKFICLDVANGYSQHFIDMVKKTRDKYPDKIIIAGNVVTGEMVEELILSGADIVKVGIGPGSVCTTRVKTGVGYPQLSAIVECADAAHGLKGHVISDGGCSSPGDVAKAFGAGADFVMLGGMLSGHDECEGELIEKAGKQYMLFYGMSSKAAMEKHSGGIADYRAAEGKAVHVHYKGSVDETIKDILGGLRSACTYVGAAKLKELSKRTTFIRVREQENRIFS